MKTTTNTLAGLSCSLLKRGACIFLFMAILSACERSDSDKDHNDDPLPDPTQGAIRAAVAGSLHFEFIPSRERCAGLDYSRAEQRPIRGATVQLIDAATGKVLDAGEAGEDGRYQLFAAVDQEVFVRVRAELKDRSWDVEVRDNTTATERPLAERPLYVLDGSPFVLEEAGAERQLIARSGWDGSAYNKPRAAAPFAILDSLYAAMTMLRQADPEAVFPPLDVFWSINNGSTMGLGGFDERMGAGQIGTSFYSPAHQSIFLLGRADDDTEEFDSHVIVHEWAHYFEQAFSRSDSPGGSHSLGEPLDKRLAFSEGWATAFSGMVLGSSLYCDTSGYGQRQGFAIDMANNLSSRPGWFNEWSMIRILYGLWSPDQPDASFEFQELYQVFTDDQKNTPAFTSIFSFASALKQRYPERTLVVDQLLNRDGISGIDSYGSNETNDADSFQPNDVLPIYSELVADGSSVEVCINDEFDAGRSGNKLSQFRYLRLQVERPGPYTLSVETQHPPAAESRGCPMSGVRSHHSDPDFQLLYGGQILADGDGCEANQESAQFQLRQGDYTVSVTDKRFRDPGTAAEFPNRICFAVRATPLF